MRAVLMTAAGGPEVLEVGELPEPEITGQRDVGVRAARGRGWSSTSRRRAPPGRARHGSTAGGHPPVSCESSGLLPQPFSATELPLPAVSDTEPHSR